MENKLKIVKIEFTDGTTKKYYGKINGAIVTRLDEDGLFPDYYEVIDSFIDIIPSDVYDLCHDVPEFVLRELNSIMANLKVVNKEYMLETDYDTILYVKSLAAKACKSLFFELLDGKISAGKISDEDFIDFLYDCTDDSKVKNISISYRE